jgi:hypothetical protein
VKALPGNPYDGHTLAVVIPEMEALVGNTIERILADKGYRGHNAPPDYKFRVFTSGQKRRMTPKIKRELRRRSAVEPVIGHLKAEHRMGRNYLWHRQGDATNAILTAVGYNLYGALFCQELSGVFLLDLQPSVNRGRGEGPPMAFDVRRERHSKGACNIRRRASRRVLVCG